MEESLGLYKMTSGMKRKYMTYFETLMEQIKKVTLKEDLGETQNLTQNKLLYCIYCGSKILVEKQTFCGNCGKKLP